MLVSKPEVSVPIKDKKKKKKNNKTKRKKIKKNLKADDKRQLRSLVLKTKELRQEISSKQASIKTISSNPSRLRRKVRRAEKFSNPLDLAMKDLKDFSDTSGFFKVTHHDGSTKKIMWSDVKFLLPGAKEETVNKLFNLCKKDKKVFMKDHSYLLNHYDECSFKAYFDLYLKRSKK